jgi:geranylgeranyl reductase family protein
MDRCDVLIVGGGPAGSSLAWGLRDSGLDVLIMDKKNFPRDKVCAGWITPAVIETLQINTEDYRKKNVFEPVRGFRIGLIGRDEIEIHYNDKPVSYGIRRYEFDNYLLARSPARLRLGMAFKNMSRDGQTWIVNNEIGTPLVVGAGGYFCPVARIMGSGMEHGEKKIIAQEIEFKLTRHQLSECNVCPDMPEIYFCDDFKGYGWVLRKGDYLNIGLGREDPHNLTAHVNAFCDYLYQRKKCPQNKIGKFNGHAYLLYQQSQRKIVSDNILLIGDAAGLACSQSGEGIRPAIESGIMAASVINNAAGNYSRDLLNPYLELITQRFGERKAGNGILTRLPVWVRQYLGHKLLATRWFTQNIVLDHWFLHSDQSLLPGN